MGGQYRRRVREDVKEIDQRYAEDAPIYFRPGQEILLDSLSVDSDGEFFAYTIEGELTLDGESYSGYILPSALEVG